MMTKTTMSKRLSLRGAALWAGLGILAPACLLGPLTLTAQAQSKAPVRRTCEGTVLGSDDKPLSGAVVYLKDTKSLSIKTFLADDDGNFHFGQLSAATDYEIHAEYNGEKSKSKGISYFDSKNDYHFTLKIDALKKAS